MAVSLPLRFEGPGEDRTEVLTSLDRNGLGSTDMADHVEVGVLHDPDGGGFEPAAVGADSSTPDPSHPDPLTGLEWGILSVALVIGFVVRWNLLAGPLGYIDLDEATAGIAAREFFGSPSVFFPNQPYGGSLELGLAAMVHLVAGSSQLVLKLTPMLLHLAAAGFVLGAARRVVPSRAGQIVAPVLFWCGPAFGVWESTKERGFYGVSVVLAAALVWLAARIDAEPNRRDVIAFGLCLGLGWWTTPLLALAAVPIVAWLLIRQPELLNRSGVVAAAALVGASPWLIWNAFGGLASLRQPPSFDTGLGDRFGDGVAKLAVLTGLETPWDPDRMLVPEARVVAVLLVGVAIAVGFLRRRESRAGLPAAVVLGYVLLYPLANSTGTVGPDPRYLYPVLPGLALAVAGLIPASRWADGAVRAVVVSAAVIGVSHWGITGMEAVSDHDARFLNARGSGDVVAFLEDREIDFAITDMAGTQITYVTGGEIRASSFAVPRFLDLEREMLVDRPSTYVLDDHLGGNAGRLATWLEERSIPYERHRFEVWTVITIDRWVPPWEARLVTMKGLVEPPGASLETDGGTDDQMPVDTDRSSRSPGGAPPS